MKKPVILITKPESLGELSALQKAHVKGYTRKDGTVVKKHDTSVTAKPKAEGFGRGDKVMVHKPGQISHGVEGTVHERVAVDDGKGTALVRHIEYLALGWARFAHTSLHAPRPAATAHQASLPPRARA